MAANPDEEHLAVAQQCTALPQIEAVQSHGLVSLSSSMQAKRCGDRAASTA
ncbi:hypothetical protein OHU11_00545 [Streptomyces sp. NBC_00257]|uniref:hypothetical protein n=1 Tax=Streptomyces TaxID=1883 RepID=UPI0022583F42|nr:MULTISPECIES: hypothetical protein [unclassified Streptomyces]WSW10167.1 hypothetical protein OG298_40695 [Streptomyces sp. NBC_01005]WTB59455.1 hypothetical protein OG832_43410 [Streptomyces sp. NBC_00826]WTC99678.1 hypothetical protein OH736_40710 [Streptomyces sp. NBC_01650]WTH87676.1 hypothetical protein OIC43_00310 [Streptomyces sp. NBC_00825]WTH96402.1 hypothetical protein OHA23_00320 [Streptomyces sp. NBC_00822]